MSSVFEKPLKRRDFLSRAALWTSAAALGTACLGMLRLVLPRALPEPSKKYKIGDPAGFPRGEIRVPPGKNVHVFHGDSGFFAISSICTHLGCIVALQDDQFVCPCHGSRFAMDGAVLAGAAPKALDWYAVSLAPDGQLMVDEAKVVKAETYFEV